MPEHRVIADTGPLIGYLNRRDDYHDWAVALFQELPAPFLTCEPVLTETFYLVRRLPGGVQRLFRLLASGLLLVDFNLMAEHAAVQTLVNSYTEVPMSLADACVVRMAEIHAGTSVFTIDRGFRVYRKHRRQLIPLIIPPGR